VSARVAGRVPGVMFVTDRHATLGRPIAEVAVAALRGGISMVQVRERDLGGAELLKVAAALVAASRAAAGARARVVVNDRLDVALAARAAGVHLPAAGLPLAAVRRHAGTRFLVGRSVHGAAEAREAERAGADYLVFGPVFETPSKAAFGDPLGPEALGRVAEAARIPVWAIGGIDAGNAATLAGLPIAGVAVIRAIAAAPDPEAAARALRAALGAPEATAGG